MPMPIKTRPAALAAGLLAFAAQADLKPGAQAPDFSTPATLGGVPYTYSLDEALKRGPVVLYFYPAAFTKGCTVEAHNFAEAIDEYKALGATVIGVSHDPIAKLNEFSVSACGGKFPVAADEDQKIAKAYDAILPDNPQYANRTSYVIAPDHTIIYSYTDMKPVLHVANTLAALQAWKARQK
jgi:peroxiredoxin (alkyl hydroperoxide reductase subunit C)